MTERLKKIAFKIGEIKGTTNYAIATTTVEIIKAIFNEDNRVFAISTLLNGEYGARDVFAGVPAILNRQGVKKIVEIHLTDEELNAFQMSLSILKKSINKLEKI